MSYHQDGNKQSLDRVFVIPRVIKVEVNVISVLADNTYHILDSFKMAEKFRTLMILFLLSAQLQLCILCMN